MDAATRTTAPSGHVRKAVLRDQGPESDPDDRPLRLPVNRIMRVPIGTIKPSPENDLIYKPIDPKDPELIALADSIRRHGIREPLVITQDHFVLSGHRRLAAAKLARLIEVPCRAEALYREGHPAYTALLAEYNVQRVKTIDMVVREEMVLADPREAHRLLRQHREQLARVDLPEVEIQAGRKQRSKISAAKKPMLDAVRRVLEELRDFMPLTDRQIHYQLLNDPPLRNASGTDRYQNNLNCYKDLCDLLLRARIEGLMPWEAIHDPTRPVTVWSVHSSIGPFVHQELNGFLKGYYRNLQQSQPLHIEVVGEKNTLANIVRPVAMQYCVPFTLGRGYMSGDPRKKLVDRFRRAGKARLLLLLLTDFDPEGEDIAHAMKHSLKHDLHLDATVVKVGLNSEQVNELKLPRQHKAKAKSSRAKNFVEAHGEYVYELEAVHPATLQAWLRDAIDSAMDVDLFNQEVDREVQDAAALERTRRQVLQALGPLASQLPDMSGSE